MLSDGSNVFTWNARNQVATLNNVSLQYDAAGRRTKNVAGTSFLYDGANAAQELSGTTVTANLLSGGVDEVFSRTDGSGTFTPLKDALGSTVALVDASGNMQTTYSYDPFGNTTASGAASNNLSQYTGRENEGNGLYFYRARYYSPLLGRFVSEDPLGFSAGINFYSYVADDPIDFMDPSGMDKKNFKEEVCRYIPSGRTVGLSGGVGIVGGQTGGVEQLINYNTGEVSGFGYGGLQAGLNGGLNGSVNAAFVWNLGDSNSNYSGPFTNGQAYVGPVGIYTGLSSGGFDHPTPDLSGPNSVGVSFGKGLAPI